MHINTASTVLLLRVTIRSYPVPGTRSHCTAPAHNLLLTYLQYTPTTRLLVYYRSVHNPQAKRYVLEFTLWYVLEYAQRYVLEFTLRYVLEYALRYVLDYAPFS